MLKEKVCKYQPQDRVTRLGNFLPIGLLLIAHCDFLKTWSSPINGNIMGYIFFSIFFTFFIQISSSKYYLLFVFWDFKSSLIYIFELSCWALELGLFGLATALATYSKNLELKNIIWGVSVNRLQPSCDNHHKWRLHHKHINIINECIWCICNHK